MNERDRFSRTLASLDTPGGHMIVCLLVIWIGAAFYLLKVPKSEDLILMASGALFGALRGKGSDNHDVGAGVEPGVVGGGVSTSTVTTTENRSATETVESPKPIALKSI